MATKDRTETFQWNNVWNQYYATFAANLSSLAHGLIVGSLAPSLSILSSDRTPLLSGPLSNEQVSWIGSINCLGGLIGSIIFGYMTSIFGCKWSLFCVSFAATAFWVLIYFGSVYYHIFIARLISGLSGIYNFNIANIINLFNGGISIAGGIQTCAILFIAEIANDDIRGRLGSVTLFMRNIAILIAYILGATIDYTRIPLVCVSVPIIFMILFFMLPNTPQYFLQRGKIHKAESSLKYYKGYKGKTEREKNALSKEFERLKSIANERKTEENLQASDFFNRTALKGLGIGFALCVIVQFSPSLIIISYAVMIFEKAGTSLDPYVSSIISAVTLILGSLLTTYLADILGRKFLNLLSLVGSAIGLFAMSLYYYLYINSFDLSAFEWVPVVSLSFVIFVSSAGITPLSIICGIEYLPPKIRTVGSAMFSVVHSTAAFVTLKLFPILLKIVDLHGCMSILAIGCVIGFLFILIVMDETSGQSLDDVGKKEKIRMEQIQGEPLLDAEK